jgi:hypothetical protein
MPGFGHPSFDPSLDPSLDQPFDRPFERSSHQSFEALDMAPSPSSSSWFSSRHTPAHSVEVPLPDLVTPSPQAEKEFLPVFASVESSWFTKPEPDHRDPAWSSPADSGWQAAGVISEPAQGGTTSSGLPRRTPKANLVPGSATPPPSPAPAPAPLVSPDRLRRRLANYQQGVRKGRAELEEDPG